MDAVADMSALFQGEVLNVDVTEANPLGPKILAWWGQRAEHALEEAVEAKGMSDGGTNCPVQKFILMTFSTRGDYSIRANALGKDLVKLRAEMEEDFLLEEDAGKFTIQATETERLRRNLSQSMRQAFVYCTLRYTSCKRIGECYDGGGESTQRKFPRPSTSAKRARRR